MRYTQGGPIYLKVLDFGIAKQMESKPGDGKLTATGAVMGTPMYMAPEQAGGTKIDARADQYAVGIVFYELLTGTVPFTGETLTGVLVSHLTKPPPPLPRQIPEPLQKVVMRLLAKSPAERFPDFAAVDQALVACEAACRDVPALSAGKVSPLMAGTPATAPNDRKTLLIGGGALGVAVVCLGLVVALGPKLRHRDKPVPPVTVTTVEPSTKPAAVEPVAKPATAEKPSTVPTTPPTPATVDKPAVVTNSNAPNPGKPSTGTKSVGPSKGVAAALAAETPEAKAKLDEAESLIGTENYQRGIQLARQSLTLAKSARAYKLIALAYCKAGDLSNSKASFFSVARADRAPVIAACRKQDIDLK